MQKLIVTGNCGADATIQNYNGNRFVSFRIAATEKFTNNGEEVVRTTWYDCTSNKADSKIVQFIKKGVKLLVIGRPSYRIYDSAVHRCKMVGVSLFCETIELCGDSSQREITANGSTAPLPTQEVGASSEDSQSDGVPF